MFCLFVRFLPMVATAEVKTVLPQADPHWPHGPERDVRNHRAAMPVRGAQARSRGSRLMGLLRQPAPDGPYYGILAEFATPCGPLPRVRARA